MEDDDEEQWQKKVLAPIVSAANDGPRNRGCFSTLSLNLYSSIPSRIVHSRDVTAAESTRIHSW
jgi:hypothetical protein